MKYYKVLLNNHSCVSSDMDWTPYLPTKNDDGTWTPGAWLPKITGKLKLCEIGYHLTDANHLIDWIVGNQLFEAEVKGKILKGEDKISSRQVRLLRKIEGWNDKNLRLFAVWCAREALKLVENPDQRSIDACNVAEKYANGDATKKELAAAWAAAKATAWDASWDAAGAAAGAASWDASWAAAKATAWDAEWAVARAASCAASCAASWAAVKAAAWDAENKKLCEMIELEAQNE